MLTELKDKIIDTSMLTECVDIISTFPEVQHRYGYPLPIIDKIYWMRYITRKANNFIAFSRNTHLHPVLNKMQLIIASKLAELFDSVYIDPLKVQFMKTKGDIPPHIDEANRHCSINIGLQHSSSAITKYSNICALSETDYMLNVQDYICRDGYGILLNTSSVHSVIGDPSIERLLITYGFEEHYSDIKSKLRLP